ncbi:hypothetical protein BG005_000393, partial [Podila minutissima]
MHFTSTLSWCLVGVLAIALSPSVEAAVGACQMCVNDVATSIPQCKGVEFSSATPKSFSDYSSSEQACLCAIAHDSSPFMKCDPLCPRGNMEKIATDSAAIGAIYCKPDGTGSLSSSSVSPTSSSYLVSAAAAIVLSAVALA